MSGFHRLSDAIEGSTSGVLSLPRETKFIIDFDFAVTLSSPESFNVLFDITSEQSVELKWLMLNKDKRWFPQYICELVFGVNVFDLDYRILFRTNCRTEMANIEQTQKMIPFVMFEISFG